MATTAGNSDRRATLIIALLAIVLIALILMSVLTAASKVTGTEFSPHTFDTRSFQFNEVPLTEVQVTGNIRTTITDSTSRYLVANKLIQPIKNNPRWDLVRISRAFRSGDPADTTILLAYLNGQGGAKFDWEQWSKDHAPAAKVFWPFIQQMAIDRLYLMMPQAFEIAENETDANALQSKLNAYLLSELPEFSRDLAAAGYRDIAVSALESAIQQHGANEALEAAKQSIATSEG